MTLTDAQRQAVESKARRVCVRAGAGSGKTRVLINRIMHLIEFEHVTLDRIVAITFTEKAALEMKARLREACRQRAPEHDPEGLTFWRKVERSVSTARISTIHAFCSGLLREHALHLDADPDFVMLEDADSLLLRDDAVRQELLRLLQTGDEDAATVAAELGFEKTYNQMCGLLKGGNETARAIEQMGDASADAVRDAWRGLEAFAQTQALRYLRIDPRLNMYRARLTSLAGYCTVPDDPREQMRQDLIAEIDGIGKFNDFRQTEALLERLSIRAKPTKKERWVPESAADDVKNIRDALKKLINDYRWESLTAEDEEAAQRLTGAFLRTFAKVSDAYDTAKASMVAHDFDDLIIRVHRILGQNELVRAEVARSMAHLLIDEFQDTDGLQWEIAHGLHEVDGGPSLFIVGDAKQSIYLFRGAEVETFAEAEELAEERVWMNDNFRSLSGVLKFVNAFFTDSKSLAAVEPQYGELRPNREAEDRARIEFMIPKPPESDTSIEAFRRAEADILATRLREMVESKTTIGDREGPGEIQRPVRYGDMAILFRAMSDAHIYEQSLRRHDVPFTIVSGAGFYERQEIRDLRNFLSLVADPLDEMALLAFLRSPLAGIADDALMLAAGALTGDGVSLTRFFASNAKLTDPDQQARLVRARQLFADARAHREWSAPELLRFVLEETGYEAMLLRQDFLGEQRANNVRKLVALAESFSHSRSPGLIQFLHYLEDVAKTELREGEAPEVSHDRNAVTLMTIHQSKGLEFPVVAVADMARRTAPKSAGTIARHRHMGVAVRVEDEEGNDLKPSAWSCIDAVRKWQERAESARVLYVALTRACDYLLISGALGVPSEGETWMREFDAGLELATREDGDEITGDGWRAVVRRSPRKRSKTAAAAGAGPRIDPAALKRRLAPIETKRAIVEVRITALAARLANAEAREAPVNGGTIASNPMALIRGTAAHRMLQLWDFQTDTRPDIPALLHGTPLDATARAQLAGDLETIAARFHNSALFQALRAEPTVQRELEVRWCVNDAYLNGVIDGWLGNGVIVDYKTGGHNDALAAQYEWQLRLYAAALRALNGAVPEKGMLCYLDQEGVPCTEFPFTVAMLDETEHRMHVALAEMIEESNE